MKSGSAFVSETSSARIADLIRTDIARGVLLPGEHIRIGDLATRYGTSHLPVREALRIVEGDRLVELIPHKGTTVRDIGTKFVENIYGLRTQIEVYLMRRSVERISEEQLKEVVRRKKAFARAVKASDTHKMAICNRDLHDAINEPADNSEATRLLRNGWELVTSLRCRFGYSPERLKEIADEHDAIVELMHERNVEGAAELIRRHCESAERDLLRRMREGEQSPANCPPSQ